MTRATKLSPGTSTALAGAESCHHHISEATALAEAQEPPMCEGHPRDPAWCCLHPFSRSECETHQHDEEREYFDLDAD